MGRVWRLDWGESHRFTESGQEPTLIATERAPSHRPARPTLAPPVLVGYTPAWDMAGETVFVSR